MSTSTIESGAGDDVGAWLGAEWRKILLGELDINGMVAPKLAKTEVLKVEDAEDLAANVSGRVVASRVQANYKTQRVTGSEVGQFERSNMSQKSLHGASGMTGNEGNGNRGVICDL